MNQAFVYLRFSPRPDAAESESLEVQRVRCTEYCRFNDLTPVKTFQDPEVSARKLCLSERPEGAKLLAELAVSNIKHVVSAKIDRMFRNTVDGLRTMDKFKRMGVAMHFADQGGVALGTNTATGEFIFTVLLGMASFEPAITAERTSKALLHKQRNMVRVSRHPPFGMKAGGEKTGEWIIDPVEQSVIRTIIRLGSSGNSDKEIASALNDSGLRRRGVHWCASFIRKILKREMASERQ